MAGLDDCYNIFDLRTAAKKRLPRSVFEFFLTSKVKSIEEETL
jgi:hypothetical protein